MPECKIKSCAIKKVITSFTRDFSLCFLLLLLFTFVVTFIYSLTNICFIIAAVVFFELHDFPKLFYFEKFEIHVVFLL